MRYIDNYYRNFLVEIEDSEVIMLCSIRYQHVLISVLNPLVLISIAVDIENKDVDALATLQS